MSSEATARKRANRALAALQTYHNDIPNADIDAILTANGFQPTAEGIYCGRDGRINEQVGKNTWLSMSWHRMEVSGRYEIVSYLS